MDDRRAVADRGAAQGGVRADLAALADHRGPLEDRARADGGVAADRHPCLHPGGARLKEGHTRAGVVLDDPALGGLLGRHEARAVVDAQGCVGVVGHVSGNCPAFLSDQRKHAGEVALALLQAHVVERVEEGLRIEDVGAEVDLPDRQLLRREAVGVLGLVDAVDGAVRVAHDPPVARRVELVRGEQGGEGVLPLVLLQEPLELVGGDQRVVGGQDHDRAPRRQHRIARGEHRGPGALALTLLGDLDPVRKPLLDPVPRPDDRNDPLRTGRPRRIGNPLDKRLTGHAMKHLRSVRKHPSALAGGHDEDRKRRGHGGMRVSTAGRQAASASRSYQRTHLRTALSLHAVLPSHGKPAHLREILLELLIGRPRNLARLRPRDAKVRPLVVRPAVQRAVALVDVRGRYVSAALSHTRSSTRRSVAPAVGVERRGAVRTDDPQVLEPVISAASR